MEDKKWTQKRILVTTLVVIFLLVGAWYTYLATTPPPKVQDGKKVAYEYMKDRRLETENTDNPQAEVTKHNF